MKKILTILWIASCINIFAFYRTKSSPVETVLSCDQLNYRAGYLRNESEDTKISFQQRWAIPNTISGFLREALMSSDATSMSYESWVYNRDSKSFQQLFGNVHVCPNGNGLKDTMHKIAGKPVVGIGQGSGADRLLEYAGQENPDNLKALVLKDARAHKSWWNVFGTDPVESIAKIKDKALPIVIIQHATDGKHSSVEQARKLYTKFTGNLEPAKNFENVYFVPQIDKYQCSTLWHHAMSKEPMFSWWTKEQYEADQSKIITAYIALQSIYKQHGLPHDAEFARLSKEELQARYQK